MSRPKPSSRANGRLSRGPKTQAGKERSRLNGLRHGIYSCEANLVAAIPAEQLAAIYEEYIREYQPRNEREIERVLEIAVARWQILYFRFYEMSLSIEDLHHMMTQGRAYGSLLARQSQADIRFECAVAALRLSRIAENTRNAPNEPIFTEN
jgi:hypothetical protein